MPDISELPRQIKDVRITYSHDDNGNLFATFEHKDKRWFKIPVADDEGIEDEIRDLANNFEKNYRGFVEQHLEE